METSWGLAAWRAVSRDYRYVAGTEPRVDLSRDAPVVPLECGERVYVAVGAGEGLALDPGSDAIDLASLSISWTTGRRLFIPDRLVPIPGSDLLLLEPDALSDRTVCIDRTKGEESPLELSLWIVDPRDSARVDRKLDLPATGTNEAIALREEGDRNATRYVPSAPSLPVRFDARGAHRVRVGVRLVWAEDDPRVRRFTVEIRSGSERLRRTPLTAIPIITRRVFVDGEPAIASVEYGVDADLPRDARDIEVRTTARAIVRVEKVLDDPVALDSHEFYHDGIAPPPASAPRSWAEKARPFFAAAGVAFPDPPEIDLVADAIHAVASDPSRPDAPIVAASLARSLARASPLPGTRSAVRRILLDTTRYLAVAPFALSPAARAIESLGWISREPLPAGEDPEVRVLSASSTDDLLHGIERSLFVEMDSRRGRLVWPLPPRDVPSLARVVVASASETDGDAGPITLVVRIGDLRRELVFHPDSDLLDVPARLSTAECGLVLDFERRVQQARDVPIVEADAIEIEVPKGETELAIEIGSGHAVRVAVDVLTPGSPNLDEESYLALVDAVERDAGVFRLLRRAIAASEEIVRRSPDARELVTQWRPLIELFSSGRERWRDERARLLAPEETTAIARGNAPWTSSAPETPAGDPVRAVELWASRAFASSGLERDRAWIEAARALFNVGENDLAERVLLRVLIVGESEASRFDALALLDSSLEEDSIERRDLVLGGAATLGTPAAFSLAVEALADAGDVNEAWLLATAVPENEVPIETALYASVVEDRPRSFERFLSRITDPERRSLWLGLEAIHSGESERAAKHLLASGEAGSEWVDAWCDIVSRSYQRRRPKPLESRDRARAGRAPRVAGISSDAGFRPGRLRAVSDESLVSAARGFRLVGRRGTSRYSLYALSGGADPLRCTIVGPATVRFDVRLVLAHDEVGVDSWIVVRGEGWERDVPITSARPLPDLDVARESEWGISRRFDVELSFGEGAHELTIEVPGRTALVRAVRLASELPLDGLIGPAEKPPAQSLSLHEDGDRDGESRGDPEIEGSPASIPAGTRARLATRGEARRAKIILIDPKEGGATSELEVERDLLSAPADGRRGPPLVPPSVSTAASANPAAALPMLGGDILALVARGAHEEILALPSPEIPAVRTIWLEALLRIAETDPRLSFRARLLGEEVARASADASATASLARRFARGLSWRRVLLVRESAGVRLVDPIASAAETPRGRVLLALAGGLREDERTLAFGDEAVLFANASVSREVEVELRIAGVALRRPAPVRASVAVDGELFDTVVLFSRMPVRRVPVALPPGDHTVRVRLEEEPEDGMVIYRFVEVLGTSTESNANSGPILKVTEELPPAKRRVPLRPEVRREYHVATADNPVVVGVEGPGRVRIHRRSRDETVVEERTIPSGVTELELPPAEGEDESLYRIFERVPDPIEPSSLLDGSPFGHDPFEPEPFDSVPTPWPNGTLSPETAAVSLPLEWGREITAASLRLGTWSVFAGGGRERALEEDEDGELRPDEYFEMRIVHRRRLDPWPLWVRGDFLTRFRPEDGPTAGGAAKVYWRPESVPALSLEANASMIAEWLGGGGASFSGSSPWAASISAAAAWSQTLSETWSHEPRVVIFGRLLDLDPRDPDAVLVRDRDVFSSYRADHRHGVALGDSFTWRPWLDGKLVTSVAVVTNEDLNPFAPDHARLSLAYAHRLYGLEAKAFFTVRHYFADDDRLSSGRRHLLGIEGSHEFWIARGSRLEILGTYEFDVERFDSSFLVGLAFHWGREGGLENSAPDELDFRTARLRLLESGLDPDPAR